MKKNILFSTLALVAVIIGFYSCKRDYTLKAPVTTTEGLAYLRIVNASPNFRSILNAPDSFNVIINGNKVTGYTPSSTLLMTYGSTFPAASSNYGYIALEPGTDEIKLSAGYLNPDSLPIISLTKTLAANTYYTFMITDSVKSTRDSSKIFIQDNFTTPTSGYFNLRFIHAVLNDTVGKTIDIWSTRTNRFIYTNVKPGTITSFTAYPYNAIFSDTLYVRRHNSGYVHDTLATLNTVSFSNQRTYTLYYRGNAGVASGSKSRSLATYVHQ